MLPRLQLFEFCDQPWWPAGLRRMLTDYLQTAMELVQPFRPRNDLLVRALRETGSSSVVDLCSGGAGPWVQLVRDMRRETGRAVSVVLTDKFPDPDAPGRLGRLDGISYHLESIDALAVSPELDGVRTIFNALHHFPPEKVRAILGDAVRQGRAIVVFEALNRSWRTLAEINLTPLRVWLLTPQIHPRTWFRTIFTYFIPIGTLAIWWDAVVSTLRCYSPDELLEMARAVDGGQFEWEAGTYRENGVPVTFLAGFPKAMASSAASQPQHAVRST